MKKFFVRFLLIGIAIAILSGIFLAYEELTGDFRLTNISYEIPHRQDLEVPKLSQLEAIELDAILSQEFHWLDHGHQIYAFESEDGRYVLKIFKFKRLKPSWILKLLSYVPGCSNYASQKEQLRVRRFEKLFAGYYLGYTQDQRNTGLIYIHLNKTDWLGKKITVRDKLGFAHEVDLDQAIFAVQERAITTKKLLVGLLEKRDLQAVKHKISQLFEMYVSEYLCGVVDHDHNLIHNTGFIGDRPIRLDLGQLKKDDTFRDVLVYKKDLIKVASKRLNNWLLKHYPKEQPEIARSMERKLSELFHEPFSFARKE